MKLVVPLRFLLINLMALQGSLAYTFQAYKMSSPSPNHVCVLAFNDFRVSQPFCIETKGKTKGQPNHIDLVSEDLSGISPKVGVYIAFDKADKDDPKMQSDVDKYAYENSEPKKLTQLCDPLLNNEAPKNQFDRVKCAGDKVYPVLWAGLDSEIDDAKYFNALVMRDNTKIDKTIVVEFFKGNYANLNARILTPRSDRSFHIDVTINPNTQPTRANLEVQYIKFPTGKTLTTTFEKKYEFYQSGVTQSWEYKHKTLVAEDNPSLIKTVVVNVAEFEEDFEVISASFKQAGTTYVLTVYIADSVGFHDNKKAKGIRTNSLPAAAESRVKMQLTEMPFLSQIKEFSDVDSNDNRTVTQCKLNFTDGCVTAQKNINPRVQTLNGLKASLNKDVYFYCIPNPGPKDRTMDAIAAKFKTIIDTSNILWSFEFPPTKQDIVTTKLILYSTEELHVKLNQIIDNNPTTALCICSANSLFYFVTTKKFEHNEKTLITVDSLIKRQRRRLIAL